MSRRIVILLDGTSNEIETDRTNIVRLYGTLEKSPEQIVWYHPGVGTMGAANAWSPRYQKAMEILGLATGWGLDRNVKEAYRFLAETYAQGDRIYVFGFSRGAYAARVLAGFVHAVGLFWPINLNLVDYAYKAYKKISDDWGDQGTRHKASPEDDVVLFHKMLKPRRPGFACLGLFDTVGSVIEMGAWRPRRRFYAYTGGNGSETGLNPSVEAVRHALAIDERRTMFQPTLWTAGDTLAGTRQDVEEVWFTGSHADVGGGYPEAQSHLAKIALEWMIDRTEPLGLTFDKPVVDLIVRGIQSMPEDTEPRKAAGGARKTYATPDPLAAPNESMVGFWPVVEYLPRRLREGNDRPRKTWMGFYIPRFARRFMPPGAGVHHSVFARRGTEADLDQPNIPTDRQVVT